MRMSGSVRAACTLRLSAADIKTISRYGDQ
jgi:hypothetical protein